MSGRLKFTLFQTTAAAGTAVVATTFPTFTALLKGCVDAAISALPALATMTPAASAAPAAAAAATPRRSTPSCARSSGRSRRAALARRPARGHGGGRAGGAPLRLAQLRVGDERAARRRPRRARGGRDGGGGGARRSRQARRRRAAARVGEAATASVGHAVGALDEKIAAGFGAVHARVAGVEANAERSARGVELLCEVLASSLAAAPASPHHGDVADRLRVRGGVGAGRARRRRRAPAVAPISRPSCRRRARRCSPPSSPRSE